MRLRDRMADSVGAVASTLIAGVVVVVRVHDRVAALCALRSP